MPVGTLVDGGIDGAPEDKEEKDEEEAEGREAVPGQLRAAAASARARLSPAQLRRLVLRHEHPPLRKQTKKMQPKPKQIDQMVGPNEWIATRRQTPTSRHTTSRHTTSQPKIWSVVWMSDAKREEGLFAHSLQVFERMQRLADCLPIVHVRALVVDFLVLPIVR